MFASSWRNWLPWAVLATFLMGCQNYFAGQGPPRDPLFFSKTPMSVKAEFNPPVAFAYLEPTLPLDPFLGKNPTAIADKNGGSVPGTLTNHPKDQE